jgi:flagellar biosynthesis chaperone FliJ
LERERKALKMTQLIGTGAVVLILGYMTFVTSTLASSLQPKSAAEIAKGVIAQKVDEQATTLAEDLKQRVPALIAQAPDYALQQMPQYREALEQRIETDLAQHMDGAAQQMDEHLNGFIKDHQSEIKQLLASADDKEAMGQLCEQMEKDFMTSLKETTVSGGESLQAKIDKSLGTLKTVQKRMTRLATATDLTPEERKTRRAIAILAQHIAEKQTGA